MDYMIFIIMYKMIFTRLCWSLLLIKLKAWRLVTLLKRDSNTGYFLPNLWNVEEHILLQNISGDCFLDSEKLIPDLLVTRKLIPKGSLGLLYTNIAQLIAHTTALYVTAYLAIMLPGLLAYCRGQLRAKG